MKRPKHKPIKIRVRLVRQYSSTACPTDQDDKVMAYINAVDDAMREAGYNPIAEANKAKRFRLYRMVCRRYRHLATPSNDEATDFATGFLAALRNRIEDDKLDQHRVWVEACEALRSVLVGEWQEKWPARKMNFGEAAEKIANFGHRDKVRTASRKRLVAEDAERRPSYTPEEQRDAAVYGVELPGLPPTHRPSRSGTTPLDEDED